MPMTAAWCTTSMDSVSCTDGPTLTAASLGKTSTCLFGESITASIFPSHFSAFNKNVLVFLNLNRYLLFMCLFSHLNLKLIINFSLNKKRVYLEKNS